MHADDVLAPAAGRLDLEADRLVVEAGRGSHAKAVE
jgi:hypothetical protein